MQPATRSTLISQPCWVTMPVFDSKATPMNAELANTTLLWASVEPMRSETTWSPMVYRVIALRALAMVKRTQRRMDLGNQTGSRIVASSLNKSHYYYEGFFQAGYFSRQIGRAHV